MMKLMISFLSIFFFHASFINALSGICVVGGEGWMKPLNGFWQPDGELYGAMSYKQITCSSETSSTSYCSLSRTLAVERVNGPYIFRDANGKSGSFCDDDLFHISPNLCTSWWGLELQIANYVSICDYTPTPRLLKTSGIENAGDLTNKICVSGLLNAQNAGLDMPATEGDGTYISAGTRNNAPYYEYTPVTPGNLDFLGLKIQKLLQNIPPGSEPSHMSENQVKQDMIHWAITNDFDWRRWGLIRELLYCDDPIQPATPDGCKNWQSFWFSTTSYPISVKSCQ